LQAIGCFYPERTARINLKRGMYGAPARVLHSSEMW